MSSQLLVLVASLASLLVVIASVEATKGNSNILRRIEDLKEFLIDTDNDYQVDMNKMFWQQQEIGNKMIARTGGSDGYALKEMSRLLATIETAFYILERNSMIIERKSFEQNLDSLKGDDELVHLLTLRVGMRYQMDSYVAAQRSIASLYKLVKYYIDKQKNNNERIAEELGSLIKQVFNLFDYHYNLAKDTFAEYEKILSRRAIEEDVELEEIRIYSIESSDYMIDAVANCNDCPSYGQVLARDNNIRSMFSSRQELEAFVRSKTDARLAKKMEEIKQSVEGKLSLELDNSDETVELEDLKKFWNENKSLL